MRRAWINSIATALIAIASTSALAVQIVKPVPPAGGQITAVTDGQNCNLNNSGHYAVATGSTLTYSWSVNPTGAATIQPVTSDWHTVRFISSRSYAQQAGVDYAPYTITVSDPGSTPPTATITVYPISLDWVEGQTKDRVVEDPDVGVKDTNGAIIHERIINVDCKGQAFIYTLVSTAYNKQRGTPPNQQNGTGRITATKFDGSTQYVAGSGCTPPPGVQQPFGRWKFQPPGGVAASWNRATQSGTNHTISITGDVLSAWWDDIEIDVGIEQAPYILHCADGLGASMDYTVAEVNVKVVEMDEAEEEATGEYLIKDKDRDASDTLSCRIERVKPDDCDGYYILAEVLGTGESEVDRVYLLESFTGPTWTAPRGTLANGELARSFYARGASASSAKKDTRIRVKLMDDTDGEAGGQTCRDQAWLTVLEAEITNPTDALTAAPATPVSGTAPSETGNEYVYSTAATNPDFALTWRMKITPDDEEIRNDIDDRMTFSMDSIGGSTPTWTDSHNLVYVSSSVGWRSRVT